MDSAALEVIKTTLDVASTRVGWATIAVTIGVIIEFAALFIFSKEMPPLERRTLAFATFIIAAGCGAEYWYGGTAAWAMGQLQQDAETRVANANKAAREADAKAQSNELEAAKLTKANLDLNAAIAPRLIDQVSLTKILRTYTKPNVRILVVLDFEARRVASMLATALEDAGWAVTPPASVSASIPDSINIVYNEPLGTPRLETNARVDHDRRVAIAISNALNQDNIEADANGFLADFLCRAHEQEICDAWPATGELLVLVGAKPISQAIVSARMNELKKRDPNGNAVLQKENMGLLPQ